MQNLFLMLAVLGRLLPHPTNVTPIGAVSLVGGAKLSRWQRWLTPFAALVLSDLLLKIFFNVTPFSMITPFVYGSFAINILLGSRIGTERRYTQLGLLSLLGSLQFFLITNLGVWMEGLLYPKTIAGLGQCYLMALPFLQNTVLGDMVWSFSLFFVIDKALVWSGKKTPLSAQL